MTEQTSVSSEGFRVEYAVHYALVLETICTGLPAGSRTHAPRTVPTKSCGALKGLTPLPVRLAKALSTLSVHKTTSALGGPPPVLKP